MTDPVDISADWVTEVIRANGRDLLGYFQRRVDSPETAADLLGDLFVVIWRRKEDLPAQAENARMWCFGAARNTLREHARRSVRQIALADALREHLKASTTHHAQDPVVAAEQSEQNALLHRAVRGLDTRSRELITLVHWDGFSIAEAADHLRVNHSTARTRYARARTRLAHVLGHPAPTIAASASASASARVGDPSEAT